MKKIKLVLEPAEVEMILDALQMAYDDDLMEDDVMLEGLCKAFGILYTSKCFVKIKVDEDTHYVADEDSNYPNQCNCADCDCDGVDEDIVSEYDDDCQCDECRADRGLLPLEPVEDEDPDVDPDAIDPDDGCWDADDDLDEDEDPDHMGCGATKQDLENVWNARVPWNTEKN